jgi:hypothetical protein
MLEALWEAGRALFPHFPLDLVLHSEVDTNS